MKLRNINPVGAITVPEVGADEVGANDTIEVSDAELAKRLLLQTSNWEPADKEAKDALKAAVDEASAAAAAGTETAEGSAADQAAKEEAAAAEAPDEAEAEASR